MGFDRAGARLLAIERDGISVTDLASSRTIRLAYPNARAVVGFDDQVWIATPDGQLLRVDPGGRPTADPVALPYASVPALVPASFGPAAAIWNADTTVLLLDDFGHITRVEIAEVDIAIPYTGRRSIGVRGATVVLPSGVTAQLTPGSSVLGGVVMSDGKAATLLVMRDGMRRLLVLSLGAPQFIQHVPVAIGNVRVAAGGYRAVAQVDARTLVVSDLRSGRELGVAELSCEISDHAIDPAGCRVAVRSADGAIELHDVADLIARPQRVEVPADLEDVDELAACDASGPVVARGSAPELPATPAPEPPPAAAPLVCPPLLALEPRARPPALEPAAARVQLDRELRSVALWTLQAIAHAWDSRRLGYGNEGRHPYELEVAALLGMGGGFAAEYVASARDARAEHEQQLADDPTWRAPGSAVGQLMVEFGLDHRAVDVLLVIAAAALHGETARLYGILANDPGRPLVDEMLVQHVLAGHHDRHDIAEELDPRAPLVRLGIVQVSARRARPFAELTVDPVVLDRLRAIPPALGRGTSIRDATRELEALDISREVLERALTALSRAPQLPLRLAVMGPLGSGRRTLVAALARHAGRDVAVIDARALPRNADAFVAELDRSLRRAHLSGFVPCIVALLDVTFDERAAGDLAAETLRAHPGPIALIGAAGATVPFAPGHVTIELPVLPETDRHRVWQRALSEAALDDVDVDHLAARYRIGPGVIRRAVGSVEPGSIDPTAAIEQYIRQTRDARLAQYARRVVRLASWSNVVLPPDVLDSLRELVARVRHRRQVFETWGMGRTMATSRGLTALFQGQPGTGKTLVAGVIARELGLDLYQVDLSKVMSKWIGETERNLATIFDAAEDGQVILLFDEADSLFAKRTEVRSSNDRYANLEVNYLLQRLDAFEGIAILTTNIGTSIDQAFKRRMSFRLSFPFPDEDTREQLWRAHLPPELPVAGPLTLGALARKYQLSGGYIRNACLRAAFLAAQEETSLHQRHLERAVALEFAELGKLSSSGAIE